ncbi:MAG: large conductance mechanosensitive channel protein MscL [Synechococcales cyanobacterium C42_A2020_086]|jgi:large conductance mechanosensitive channel|nr:large conductance mechanosensitive channel protein MscL [Synechococcales cyanobacterium M58_A2018_015]MBF2072342.1 large conductance mechanosensitive channel protein MscL [Synechococcales cyanobacterium C42_A2020_086]
MARSNGGFWRDFRDFINRGNVIDLAVAVVVGGAFGNVVDKVVSLITTALLNPTMQALGIDRLADWPAGEVLVAIINFLVIAFIVFLIIRALEKFKRRQAVEGEAPDPVLTQQRLADSVDRLSAALESRRL